MRVWAKYVETWQAEYRNQKTTSIALRVGEAEVPKRVWNRLQRAQEELEKARDAIAKYFPEDL